MNNDSEEVLFEYTGKEFNFPKDMTILRFHPSITKILACSFENCTKLREVVLHEGIVQIGKTAFSGCSSLESITFPSSMVMIYAHAFHECFKLRNVVLNEGLREIGTSAFSNCDSLECITIPSTVKVIKPLRGVVLNDGIKRIKSSVFQACSSLERIKIPSTLIEIGGSTFWDCTSLRKVELSDGIDKIGWDAFWGCLVLDKLDFSRISTRLNNIIQTGHYPGVGVKIDDIISGMVPLERRGSEFFTSTIHIVPIGEDEESDWSAIKQTLDRVFKLFAYYELKEATTLFELALWKAKLDQAEEAIDISRDSYRIGVPGPIKDTILQYLFSEVENVGSDSESDSHMSGGDEDEDSYSDSSDDDT